MDSDILILLVCRPPPLHQSSLLEPHCLTLLE
jgi:hypothetical protein